MAAVFLESAESPLATYHIEFVSSPWDTALLALTLWVEVSQVLFSPSQPYTGVTAAAIAVMKWASLGSTLSPLQTLSCRAEKSTSASIRCACAKGLYQDICS